MHLQSGASGLDGWVWDGSLGGLRHRAPYGATLITTFSAIFINNIIFEIIGPFCDVNFIYTYSELFAFVKPQKNPFQPLIDTNQKLMAQLLELNEDELNGSTCLSISSFCASDKILE